MIIAQHDYKSILEMYQELSVTLTFADDCLSYPVFAAVTGSMLGLFRSCCIVLSLYKTNHLNISTINIIIGMYSIFLLMLMVPAASTNEAARAARKLIGSLPGWFPQRSKEINLLILRIFKDEPALTLGNIYRIEKSLLISAIGTLITYGFLVGTFESFR
ncbi:hypothetical protein AVEN_142577-1 [Araneus ventricosus]|uniref:Uncharacterized protein n=1 Tax=Araneus ventricosus TaxID=182803 RepID=A0A4Y2CHS8_ARAVE|nr:hypothetical protein AVEN_142577-1 [Araneus ventricosus]